MLAKFVKVEICFLILGTLGGVGWFVLSTLFTPWDYVGTVQGLPTELSYAPYSNGRPIYVRTSSDQTFICNTTCELTETPYLSFRSFETASLTPLPPGTVVASVVGEEGGVELIHHRHIITLDDGSIWTWEEGAFDDLAPYVYGFMGAALGVSFGILFYNISAIFRPRPPMKAKNDAKRS